MEIKAYNQIAHGGVGCVKTLKIKFPDWRLFKQSGGGPWTFSSFSFLFFFQKVSELCTDYHKAEMGVIHSLSLDEGNSYGLVMRECPGKAFLISGSSAYFVSWFIFKTWEHHLSKLKDCLKQSRSRGHMLSVVVRASSVTAPSPLEVAHDQLKEGDLPGTTIRRCG